MRITRRTTLFFDASVLVAASLSQEGGSALLLEACKMEAFTAQTTFLIIMEAFHALEEGLPQRAVSHLHEYLAEVNWEILPVPRQETLQEYASFIHPKDLHVLAAAVESGSEFLLTLDRRHILTAVEAVKEAGLPIRILTPGHFIQQYFPLHEQRSSLPSGERKV